LKNTAYTILAIFALAINNNLIEFLSGNGYQSSTIMIVRGTISFLITILIALILKKSVKPQNYKTQIIRIFIEGSSIWLLYESFKYLSAGSVSLVQRMDVPLLVLISHMKGIRKNGLQFYFSIWAILLLIFFVFDARFIDEEPVGFMYAFGSVVLLSTTFFIIKEQTAKESLFAISTTYSLSLIVVGVLSNLIKSDSLQIQTNHIWAFGLTGIFQVIIVLLALYFFKNNSSEKARLPFIIGALATLLLEMFAEQKIFNFNQIGLSTLITGIIVTICINPEPPNIISKPKL
jgi:drug/metabolite transporter (DMT)-like permease